VPPPTGDDWEAAWRDQIDSLAFRLEGHAGVCVVHRRAFETLLGHRASPAECAAYFTTWRSTFARAAAAKIARAALGNADNFHLTSRDIARVLGISPI
jgi:hypothetical protein